MSHINGEIPLSRFNCLAQGVLTQFPGQKILPSRTHGVNDNVLERRVSTISLKELSAMGYVSRARGR
jgi:hypothetical protein